MFKKSFVLMTILGLLISQGAVSPGRVSAATPSSQAVKLFAVSAQGGASTNEIYRYDISSPTSTPMLERTITDPSFDAPCCLAFNSTGELFVINRSASHASGSISRLLNPTGAPVSNGTITSSNFYGPHWAAFRNGELFVAQEGGSNVLRFRLGSDGTAQPNGSITTGLAAVTPRGAAVNASGELFVTECCYVSEVDRYVIDENGNAVPNGTINGNGLSNPHDMAFSPWGELFVANAGNNTVSRFLLDPAGNAVPNGQITGPTLNGPIGLDFSPWGELFVGNHYGSGGISRFLFDSSHNAIPNGFFSTPNTLGDIQFYPVPTSGNQPPIVDAGGPYSVTEGNSIVVTAFGSDPENGSLTYAWDLDGNGSFEVLGQSVVFSASGLTSPGVFTITVQATDNGGLAATDQTQVNILAAGSTAKMFVVSRQGGDSTNEIYRYTVTGPNDPAQLETTITRPNITNPYGLAFSATGELYVSNAYVNPSIARLLDPVGAATANGAIVDAGLTNPVGMVIRDGLLYVAQTDGVVRVFSLDASGNGTLIGTISDHLQGGSARNVAINPAGTELLVTQCCGGDSVARYTIDGPGIVRFKGVINGNELGGSHDLVFSPWGELFVANAGNSISRFTFDQDGNAVPNGELTGNGLSGPLGLDFSPWGELFAASHFDSIISRWTFSNDALHTASPNGSFSTPNTMADLIFTIGNQPPTVDAGGPYSVNEGASITIAASGNDPEGGSLTYAWDLGNDGTFETPGQTVTYTAAFGSAGTYTVAVQATDSGGLTATDQAIVSVTPVNQTAMLLAVSRQGNNSTNEIYRYEVPGLTGTPTLELTITDSSFNSIYSLAFSSSRELFVTNVAGGSVSRLLNATGVPVSNGTITSTDFLSPCGAVFRGDELFVAQCGGNVLRFAFDATGATIPGGTIAAGLVYGAPRGIAVSPWDELFIAQCCLLSQINRYRFDAGGSVIPNGVIASIELFGPHDVVFSPWGELFVANSGNNNVLRFLFDATGNAVLNGQITGPALNNTVGLAFSPWGELFVGNHSGSGGISRWTFDAAHNAVYNGFFSTPNTLGDIEFALVSTTGNQPPTVGAGGPYSVNEGASITVTASGSDPEGGALTYEWDLDNDGSFETLGQSVTFSAAGLDGPSTHTVAVQVTDSGGLSDTDQATVTVENVAPSITSVSNSGPIEEGSSATITVTATDPAGANDPLSYEFDCDGDGAYEIGSQPANSAACTYGDNGNFVVNVRVSDDGGTATGSTTVIVNNVAPSVGAITAPSSPVPVNTPINTSVNFTDPGTLDTHTAVWDWGDGSTSVGEVNEVNGSGSVTGNHVYISAGVYTVMVTVADDDGDSDDSVFQYIVVYDPDAGRVKGNGWIDSPVGAYTPDSSLIGKAKFEFEVKYEKGLTVPACKTDFRIKTKATKFEFLSTNCEWLVIAGAKAQYTGSGTINGSGDYGIMLTAIDGKVNGGGGVDKLRIKIWDKATGDVIYDNQMSAEDTADPTTALGGGNIVIHK